MSFAPFCCLPFELQDMIWEYAIPPHVPRIFFVSALCYEPPYDWHPSWKIGHVKPPLSAMEIVLKALLRTCQRARTVSLRRIQLMRPRVPIPIYCHDQHPPLLALVGERSEVSPHPTVVDGAREILFVTPYFRSSWYLSRVRHLAVPYQFLTSRGIFQPFWWDFIKELHSLRTIYIYIPPMAFAHSIGACEWVDEEPSSYALPQWFPERHEMFLTGYGGDPDTTESFEIANGTGQCLEVIPKEEVRKVVRGLGARVIVAASSGIPKYKWPRAHLRRRIIDEDFICPPMHIRLITDSNYREIIAAKPKECRLHEPRYEAMEQVVESSNVVAAREDINESLDKGVAGYQGQTGQTGQTIGYSHEDESGMPGEDEGAKRGKISFRRSRSIAIQGREWFVFHGVTKLFAEWRTRYKISRRS